MLFHVVFSTNNSHHLRYLAVAVRSVVFNCSKPSAVRVHILWSQLSEDDLARLKRSWADFEGQVQFHRVDPMIEAIKEQHNHGFWNYFWLDRFLPESAERCLYLDCDIVCSRDISELWEIDLGDCVVGAVPDPLSVLEPMAGTLSRHAHLVDLPYHDDDLYVNSGMLLIDLARWREVDMAAVVARNFPGKFGALPLHDQDSLNLILRHRILELSPCWNLIEYARLYSQWPYEIYQGEPKEYFVRKIRHFSGERKPDCPWVRLTDKQEFYEWLDQTDWRAWRSKWDRSLPSLVFSRLLEMHYLVCRGFQQAALEQARRKLTHLLLEAPYLVPIYGLLPIYRLAHRGLAKVRGWLS